MRHTFHAPSSLLTNPIDVIVVGCGGTGCEVVDALARMHISLLALGHPGGLKVTLVDGDSVDAVNIGRQRFAPSDIGKNKAMVLAARYNVAYGLEWEAFDSYVKPDNFVSNSSTQSAGLLITCVDRASLRVGIGKHFKASRRGQRISMKDWLWLDFGNGASTGQAILGHLVTWESPAAELRLPNVHALYPNLHLVDDDAEPSCSLAEALRQQELGINRMVADAGMFTLLMPLLTKGKLEHHGVMVDMLAGRISPLLIDTDAWAFMTSVTKGRRSRKDAKRKDRKTTRAVAGERA